MIRTLAALFILCWFAWFARGDLAVGFAPDDMMNLHGYWKAGPAHAAASQVMLGTNVYRPMGALFYLPLYGTFGLNPLPFRVVQVLLLLLNVWLLYRVALRLGCSELAAGLAALIVCYHGGLADLHYNTAVIYDVLCFTFYCCTFLYYTRVRLAGRLWGWREWFAFLALYLCTLNSKEMAVTLPVVLMMWEWLYCERREWGPAVAAAVMTAIYIAGKKFGADPLMAQEAYRPVFTFERFFASSNLHLNELFYAGYFFTTAWTLALWTAAAAVAWLRRTQVLRFCWLFILISPLPVVFLQGRTHSCLYLPLAGWAIFLAVLVTDAASVAARERRWVYAAIVLLGVAWLGRFSLRRQQAMSDIVARHGILTTSVISEFRAANPRVQPGSRVLLIDDPFQDWDAKFIAELWFGDRTTTVHLQNKTPLTDAVMRKEMQAAYRFTPAGLVQVWP